MHHNRVNPRNALDALDDRIKKLTDAHERMRTETTHTVQIHSDLNDTEVQDPIEGEVRINATNEKIGWRVNDAWHYPGGDPDWAALYSGNTVWGQPILSDGNSKQLHFPAHDQSDGSGGLFTFNQYSDPDLIMPQIFTVTLQQSGLYTFSLDVFWIDPVTPEMRNTYYVGRISGGSFKVPGSISQPFVNFPIWGSEYHQLKNFSDWDHTHALSWTRPVLISGPCEIDARVAHETCNAAGNTVGVENSVDSRFIIEYHGEVKHAANDFLAQD